ncbi:uncharacterized protein LOC120358680 [Solenopsis invicta]|uniref:uncharacterized protein LOC120358680 n=1 Tax=Solenopsis invicta TaxID=13686 RepID=UPI00193E9D58|nr:uncharacterized protein LOC120358680 [Solenopsis invicta]
MAKRKTDSSCTNSESCKTSNSCKFVEKQLLLPTIYKLNLSFGKKVIIGFEEDEQSGDLYPAARLIGKDFIGVSFKTNAWYNFQKDFNTISEYFDTTDDVAEKMRDQQFIKEDFLLLFTISYGQRSIIIEGLQNYCREELDIQNRQDAAKKRRKFNPWAIIIQKNTFDNLKEICVCINERLKKLEAITECVNYCKDILIKRINIEVSKNDFKMDLHSVTHFIKTVRSILEKQICNEVNIKYPIFAEQEFHIIFLELTTIYRTYTAQKVINAAINTSVLE